jgi:hypothetical protein
MILRGNIVLRSKNPMRKSDMKIFSIGGFAAIDSQEREFCFDWTSYEASVIELEDGHLEIDVDLREFDEEFWQDSNEENGFEKEYTDPSFIVNSQLVEVSYEAFENEVTGPLNPFEVVEFTLHEWVDDTTGYKTYEFSKENLKVYEEEYTIEED